ncbi:MAG: prolyl-tRNA synthetase [Chaenotheca gracillima]|nr:MAG: prolyl-tRNA synthetase [Chaenotheca gracillima]
MTPPSDSERPHNESISAGSLKEKSIDRGSVAESEPRNLQRNKLEASPFGKKEHNGPSQSHAQMSGHQSLVDLEPEPILDEDRMESGSRHEAHEETGDLSGKAADLSLSSEPLESSVTTLKPPAVDSPAKDETRAPTPPPKDDTYLDPTPKTPLTSGPPSRSPSDSGSKHREPHVVEEPRLETETPASAFGEVEHVERKDVTATGPQRNDSRSEIQSIMDQFDEEGGGPGVDEVMSPRLEFAGPFLGGSIQHPPRKSSLEPVESQGQVKSPQTNSEFPPASPPQTNQAVLGGDSGPPVPPKSSPGIQSALEPPQGPSSPLTLQKSQPPAPDPESDLSFDFHRFLEQLRHRTADPVAKFLRSFLMEFGKKQWMVHEQVKIISDFLAFITNKMAQCEVWRDVSDAEFDNAREGMEKLVMNRLYTQTFSPAIPPPQPVSDAKSKRKQPERSQVPGRRGQHQEDVERDEVLAQKVRIYGWIREEHLDIQSVESSGKRFLNLAQKELLKIRTYRAPRDKVICVLNCCKVIFGLLRNSKSDQSADSFVPMLIYVVLRANPEHLVSNVQYILRFRNQDKLGGEAGYYLSSLMGAIQFIENLDRTSLTITDAEFEQNVESAVSVIAERPQPEARPPSHVQVAEKSAISRPEVTPRSSLDGEYNATPRRSTSSRDSTDNSAPDNLEDQDAVSGLLRTIQKPLSSIGRIFSDDPTPSPQQQRAAPPHTPVRPIAGYPGSQQSDLLPARAPPMDPKAPHGPRRAMHAEDAAALQASAETAEAQRLQRAEHAGIVEYVLLLYEWSESFRLTPKK